MKHLNLLCILLILICSCENGAREKQTVLGEQEILAELSSYYADFSDRNWDGFRSHFWAKATLGSIWKPEGRDTELVSINSVDHFVLHAPEGPGRQDIFTEEMTSHQITSNGNLAQAWVNYEAAFGNHVDSLEHWKGTDAFTLLFHQGEWKITSITYSSDY